MDSVCPKVGFGNTPRITITIKFPHSGIFGVVVLVVVVKRIVLGCVVVGVFVGGEVFAWNWDTNSVTEVGCDNGTGLLYINQRLINKHAINKWANY